MPLSKPPELGRSMLPAGSYAGQVVLITGGGTGLGKAMAIEFARLGASLVIASRKPEKLERGRAQIAELGGEVLALPCDIREPDQISDLFDQVESTLGPVSVLVNNAAANFPVPAEAMSSNAWRTVTQIVLDGTYFCSAEFARRRLAQGGGGAILNVGATYAWTGGPGTAHSAAAKAAVTNLTQSLAVEWAPDDIRVNCLAPGLFLNEDHPEETVNGIKGGAGRASSRPASRVPGGRTGAMHELGWAATYLCSPFAAYITGHTLVVDGANWLRRSLVMPEFETVRETIVPRDKPSR